MEATLMSALTKPTQIYRDTPHTFADEHLIYHMIQTAVDVQPNGYFRYISKTASDRMNCSRATIDRKIDFYEAKGLISRVLIQDQNYKQGRARFFKFLDAALERILFAFHSVQPDLVVLGPGQSSADFEAMKERLRGKSSEVKKTLENHLVNMPIQVQLLPESAERKIADSKRWPLIEANDVPMVEYLDIPNPVAYEERLLRIAKEVDAPDRYIKSLTLVIDKAKKDYPDANPTEEAKIVDLKPVEAQRLERPELNIFYPWSLKPVQEREQVTIDTIEQPTQSAPVAPPVRPEPLQDYPEGPHPSWSQSPLHEAPADDYRLGSIHIEDRAFDYIAKEDDSKVLALITETLSTNMKWLQELSQMLSAHKMKDQLTALIDMKDGIERENEQLRKENEQLRNQLKTVQQTLRPENLRRSQLDAYTMFETFFNLPPQEMYHNRKKYAKQIEDVLQNTFQELMNLSRNIK
ncbi:hypothetical protein C0431_12715 [bacterium]|nr:hypothetical protein [bacterium]